MVQQQQERLALLLPPLLLVPPSPSEQPFNPSPGLLSLVPQTVTQHLATLPLEHQPPTEDDLLLGLRPLPTSPPSSET
jgi:hypothetical protein